VTDYISKFSENGELFLPRLFQGFPEIKGSLDLQQGTGSVYCRAAGYCSGIQGVPIKVVYLGHRYGSALVVKKNGPVHTFADFARRTIQFPVASPTRG